MERTIVCLKWGKRYSADYANFLRRGVARNLSGAFRFVCFTDDDSGLDSKIEARNIEQLNLSPHMRQIWWKLALPHPAAGLSGRCLFCDLDVMITGDLTPFFTFQSDRFCIIHNWIERRKEIFRARPPIGNSSVFAFSAGGHSQPAELFAQDPARAQDRNLFRTEQAFLTRAVGLDNLSWWPEEWVRSFKRHCRPIFPLNLMLPPRLPAGARIVAFHGKPDPHEAITGFRGTRPHHHTLPAPHLRKFFR